MLYISPKKIAPTWSKITITPELRLHLFGRAETRKDVHHSWDIFGMSPSLDSSDHQDDGWNMFRGSGIPTEKTFTDYGHISKRSRSRDWNPSIQTANCGFFVEHESAEFIRKWRHQGHVVEGLLFHVLVGIDTPIVPGRSNHTRILWKGWPTTPPSKKNASDNRNSALATKHWWHSLTLSVGSYWKPQGMV